MTILTTATATARTAVATLVILGLSSGIAVANPCETDAAFASANDCATPAAPVLSANVDAIPAAQVLSASVSAPSAAVTMAPGLGLLVR